MMNLEWVRLLCSSCGRGAVRTTFDQEEIFRCPECDDILYRPFGLTSSIAIDHRISARQ